MKDKTKIILGALAGAAAGVAVGIAITDKDLVSNIREGLGDAGDKIALKLQDLVADSKDLMEDLKGKMARNEAHVIDLDSDIQSTEG